MRNFKQWVGVAVGVACVGAAAWAGPQVPVLTVAPQSVPVGQEWSAVVEAVRQATVAAQASGRVLSVRVKVGDKVQAGQVLATIDDRDAQTTVARSQAQVAQADAELAQARAHVQRQRELFDQGFVSAAARDAAQAQWAAAQAARAAMGAGAQQARLAQSFTQVTAPFDGHVAETLVQAGDLALPGKPVASVYAPHPLRVVVQVPASQSPAQGPAAAWALWTGTQWLAPSAAQGTGAADPVSQTLTWKLEVPAGAASTLMPGQQTRVRWRGASVQRLVLPSSAVLRRGELTGVYLASGPGFVLKAVRLGATQPEGVEVLAGLKPGDVVATDAVQAGLAGARPAP